MDEKSTYKDSFIQKCLNGEADPSELDEYIEYWHTHSVGVSLREYLGLTPTEYEEWGKGNDAVFSDILAHKEQTNAV